MGQVKSKQSLSSPQHPHHHHHQQYDSHLIRSSHQYHPSFHNHRQQQQQQPPPFYESQRLTPTSTSASVIRSAITTTNSNNRPSSRLEKNSHLNNSLDSGTDASTISPPTPVNFHAFPNCNFPEHEYRPASREKASPSPVAVASGGGTKNESSPVQPLPPPPPPTLPLFTPQSPVKPKQPFYTQSELKVQELLLQDPFFASNGGYYDNPPPPPQFPVRKRRDVADWKRVHQPRVGVGPTKLTEETRDIEVSGVGDGHHVLAAIVGGRLRHAIIRVVYCCLELKRKGARATVCL